ncbi:phage tail protein [Synechococcus elongatus]|uniref:Phage tail collar domain-containing protein n=1 Tax=Synechococcus elongatus (strain ATCC 33912 / PCC 7942 / FACHB-805) TaxID=1140 RepID=Q31Q92_SYNE7|nr:phage tail protein [Synechococcus elongatus]ABB56777.1 conserved hypothetical protein [Synechococcus elongatus PCC 7942 = FACHB-805]AJD58682.1 hypothetical protein M744_13015 [Synechococcus elongatus UTEX 2973]MBD2588641.1 hypothetical protein [Synechococcus elongatus FACHB-242]MBD2689770.1 hypothetical protein [Synechococcus elongatus FACHB-1061]MBD2708377.1 hypothetical protein [Synechococcus elongatus PCC 7942 = FACHB-805]
MATDDRTTNQNYQKPSPDNQLAEDVLRLRAALDAIDADVAARPTLATVEALIDSVLDGAPGALDTLNELAAALGDDPSFAATVTTALANRYTKAESDARYVQGTTQTENVFTAGVAQTSYTLTAVAASPSSILVTVDGVVQPTSEYSLSMDGLTLTLSEAPATGARVRVLILGTAGNTNAPGDDTVTTVKLRDGAVTFAKVNSSAIASQAQAEGGTAPDKLMTSERVAQAIAALAVPAGVAIWVTGNTPPTGYIKANGALLSRTTYARLWAYAQASGNIVSDAAWTGGATGSYSTGDGSTTFRVPDLRGEFIRGWADGRSVDTGRAIGSTQADELKAHAHYLDTRTAPTGGGTAATTYTTGTAVTTSSVGGTETRPRNIAYLACIKF